MKGLNRAQIALRNCTHDAGVLSSRTTVATRALAAAPSLSVHRPALQGPRLAVLHPPHAISRCFSQTAALDSKSRDKRLEKRSAERRTPAGGDEAPSEGRAQGKSGSFDRAAAFDLDSVNAEYARIDERYGKRLQQFQAGGRFNPDVLGQLRVRTERGSDQTYPLRELAQVVPRGGRTVSIMVSDAAYIKPIMSAVQASGDFNQQPQRDPDNELELVMRIQPENPKEEEKRLRAEVTAWRDSIRAVLTERRQRIAGWLKDNNITKDDKVALEKAIKAIQDKKIDHIDKTMKQLANQVLNRLKQL